MRAALVTSLLVLGLCALADASRPGCSHADADAGDELAGAYPAFCKSYPCPPFVVEGDRPGYEIRTYNATKYVVTTVNGSSYSLAYARASSRLYHYFRGGSYEGATLETTTPFSAMLLWADGGDASGGPGGADCGGRGTETLYTFGYWIPPSRQASPPKPSDDAVIVVEFPTTTFYTRVFGGFAPEAQLEKQAQTLGDLLDKDGTPFWRPGFLARIYDAPTQLWGRHNEVAVFAEDPTGTIEAALSRARLARADQ